MVLRSCADSTTKKIPRHLSEMEGIGRFKATGLPSFPVMPGHTSSSIYACMLISPITPSQAVEKVVHNLLAWLPKLASTEALSE